MTAWTAFAAGVATEDLELELLLEALFQRFGVDFRGYARPALRRRLAGLMRAQGLSTISRLQEHVLHESGAIEDVLRALAVAPAGLFAEPGHTRQMAAVLAPCLRASAVPKIWLAECAGVGEAWALAVLLADEHLLSRTQIYATVCNEELVAEAVDATLPAESMAQYQQSYELAGGTGKLADYFEVSGERASLLPQLREHITWAQYSLVTDASFNEFEAIVCPGALADFGPVLRQRVLRLFHESLALFGVLGIDRELSPSDACFDRYQQVAAGQPWYKRIA